MENKTGRPKDHISFSQIDLFLKCKQKYYMKYHQGMAVENDAMKRGSLFHDTAKGINEIIMRDKDSLAKEDAIKIFHDEFIKYSFGMDIYNEGKRYMIQFAEEQYKRIAVILAIEWEARVELPGGVVLEGRIDEICQPEPAAIEIIDYKSGPLTPSKDEIFNDPQLRIYAHIVYNAFKDSMLINKVYISQKSLATGIKQKVEVPIDELADVEEFLKTAWDQIGAETKWEPSPDLIGECATCETKCQAYKDFIGKEYRGVDVASADIFEEFLKLKAKESAIGKEIENFKKAIKAALSGAITQEVKNKGYVFKLKHVTREYQPQPLRVLSWDEIEIVKPLKEKLGGTKK